MLKLKESYKKIPSVFKNKYFIVGFLFIIWIVFLDEDNLVSLNMYDSYGDGWNGNTYSITNSSGVVVATGGLLSGSSGFSTMSLGVPSSSMPSFRNT